MPRFAQSMVLAIGFSLSVTPLQGQQGKLGLNLRINRENQVGVTWFVSPSFAIRPSLTATWSKFGASRTTEVGVDLDFLFRAATWDRITSYYGLGGSVTHGSLSGSGITLWQARVLFGVRAKVLEWVSLFGEVGVEYQGADLPGNQRVTLATFPLGVVVFLK